MASPWLPSMNDCCENRVDRTCGTILSQLDNLSVPFYVFLTSQHIFIYCYFLSLVEISQMDIQRMLFSFMKRVVIIFSFKKQYGYEKIGAMGANSDT